MKGLYVQNYILRPSALTATHNMFVLAPTQRSLKALLKVLTFHSFGSSVLSTSYPPPQSPHSFLQPVTLALPIIWLYLSSTIQLFLLSSICFSSFIPSPDPHTKFVSFVSLGHIPLSHIYFSPFLLFCPISHLIPLLCTTSSGLIFHLLSHLCRWPPHLYLGWLALKPKNHSSFSTHLYPQPIPTLTP